jgi:hypothetical protein
MRLKIVRAGHSRTYSVSGGIFRKGGLEAPEIEFHKSQQLSKVARAFDFVAAAPVSFDAQAGQVSFKFIEGLEPIRNTYISHLSLSKPGTKGLESMYQAGRVLASIHRNLELESAVDWVPTAAFATAYKRRVGDSLEKDLVDMPLAIAHCDYGFSNVCLVRESGKRRIAIIDASGNDFVTFNSNLRAPIYVDIANFIACIEGLVPLRHYLTAHWSRLEDLRSAFLSGYALLGWNVNRRMLDGMVYATASAYFQKRFGYGLTKPVALLLLFNRWKGNAR